MGFVLCMFCCPEVQPLGKVNVRGTSSERVGGVLRSRIFNFIDVPPTLSHKVPLPPRNSRAPSRHLFHLPVFTHIDSLLVKGRTAHLRRAGPFFLPSSCVRYYLRRSPQGNSSMRCYSSFLLLLVWFRRDFFGALGRKKSKVGGSSEKKDM